jgi:hypothetical protein
MKTVNKKLIAVSSSGEELWEITYAELSDDDCVGESDKEIANFAEGSSAVGDVSRGGFI